jgi:P-aminobenzoate N-oxygenase AurF
MTVTDTPRTMTDDATWQEMLDRLNRLSVDRHFDAYEDVPWDDPAYAIDPADPRWELPPHSPLGATDWYRRQPPERRAELGLFDVASKMKVGLQFENVLKRGLLEFALELPDRTPEFRYAYHELIEEAQHSLMFQEFVNRAGLEVGGMRAWDKRAARRIAKLGRRFPAAFFFFVLGGEDPIDHVQREVLGSDRELHPLLERIMRIHVTEEARHLSFARNYLRRRVPALPWRRRQVLKVQVPVTLGVMAAMMLRPSPAIVRRYGTPRRVLRQAYGSPEARAGVVASLRKVRDLCDELGMRTRGARLVWRVMGLDG